MGLVRRGAAGKLNELRDSVEQYLDGLDSYRAAMQMMGQGTEDEVPAPEPPVTPQALQWYIYCDKYHCLPVAGGLFDQPYWLWLQMEVAGETYERIMDARQQHAEAGADTESRGIRR